MISWVKIILIAVISLVFAYFLSLIWSSFALYSINPLFPPSGNPAYSIDLMYPSTSQPQGILLDANFAVVSTKPIAEGVDMTITDPHIVLFTGTDSNKLESNNIVSVEIGFRHAQPAFFSTIGILNKTTGQIQNYNHKTLSGEQFWLTGKIDNDSPIQFPFESFQNVAFNFPVAGDYSPSMDIYFKNGSSIQYTDDEVKLHVPSTSEIQTQTFNQVNGLIAIALLVFSYIEALKLILDLPDKLKS